MTQREQIEQAARELEQAASNEDEGVTLTWNRTTAINFTLAEIEKATAGLQEKVQGFIDADNDNSHKLDRVAVELEQSRRELAELRSLNVANEHALNQYEEAAQKRRAYIKQLERQCDQWVKH